MAEKSTATVTHCAEFVRARDEDRWLSARYAAPGLRQNLLALYAFHGEIARTPDTVSEAPLGEIRLQWWRDALDEIVAGGRLRAHPTVEALADTRVVDHQTREIFDNAIEAQARLLYREPFESAASLVDWAVVSEGYVEAMAVQLAGGPSVLVDAASRASAAFAVARLGHRLTSGFEEAETARDAAWKLLGEARLVLRNVPANMMPAIAHLSLTPLYLRTPSGSPSPIARRARVFISILTGKI